MSKDVIEKFKIKTLICTGTYGSVVKQVLGAPNFFVLLLYNKQSFSTNKQSFSTNKQSILKKFNENVYII